MAHNELFINGENAFQKWGIVLGDTSLSALMTPASLKDFIKNDSRLKDGSSVILSNPKVSERQVTIVIFLLATSELDFFTKYNAFCTEVLQTGRVNIRTIYQPGVEYKMIYESWSQFSQFERGMAKFTLKLIEPNPKDREIV
jgi:hypothetical protein